MRALAIDQYLPVFRHSVRKGFTKKIFASLVVSGHSRYYPSSRVSNNQRLPLSARSLCLVNHMSFLGTNLQAPAWVSSMRLESSSVLAFFLLSEIIL